MQSVHDQQWKFISYQIHEGEGLWDRRWSRRERPSQCWPRSSPSSSCGKADHPKAIFSPPSIISLPPTFFKKKIWKIQRETKIPLYPNNLICTNANANADRERESKLKRIDTIRRVDCNWENYVPVGDKEIDRTARVSVFQGRWKGRSGSRILNKEFETKPNFVKSERF